MRFSRLYAKRSGRCSRCATWRPTATTIRGEAVTLIEKPGMASYRTPDVAASLLAEHLEAQPGDTVLNLNCGNGSVALVASWLPARRAARIELATAMRE